jgi:hypothetical protein
MIAKLVLFNMNINCVIHGAECESSGGASSLPTWVKPNPETGFGKNPGGDYLAGFSHSWSLARCPLQALPFLSKRRPINLTKRSELQYTARVLPPIYAFVSGLKGSGELG